MCGKRYLVFGIAVAAVLWFYMFSPWTSGITSFWLNMSFAAVVLTVIAAIGNRNIKPGKTNFAGSVLSGVAIAFALWCVFWAGDKISQLLFSFARGQVDNVYGMKEGSSPVMIALLLLFVIGPAEEYFWRGFVQKNMSDLCSPMWAMIVTTVIYALVHIWSFNFMLVMAALVAGAVWGILYWLKPSLLPALIVSHAVWDALVFVILPI
ncbi:MAG: CPBP family intramembrane metalloprotease [Bacteroidales bacterium]|nr:CPBP family intramembrane metalloprotease [Candidatus Cacconaster scatequi]